MAELGELFGAVLNGAIKAIDDSERRSLVAHAEALAATAGKEPGIDEALKAMQGGWIPSYYAGAELQVGAQLSMSTARERKVAANGKVTFGPISVEGGLSTSLTQGTTTNLSVNCVMRRQARSYGLEEALSALRGPGAPAIPVPVP